MSEPSPPPTERARVRRLPDRGRYEREAVEAILDEALICHLGLADDEGRPFVIPTIHARIGDRLYLHGSPASRALRGAGAAEVCVVATLVDGLVLARSAFHHSVNYRSVVLYGRAEVVDHAEEKAAALAALVEHVVSGRSADARPPSELELRKTLVLRVPIDEASAKVRTGGPVDDLDDMGLPVWAGVVPLRTVAGEPEPDGALPAGVEWPAYPLRRGD